MELVNGTFSWKWDSETENWIMPNEQHNETEEQCTSEENQFLIKPEQNKVKTKPKEKRTNKK
jgi:hypothetical protein